jgi:GxxExxY protein
MNSNPHGKDILALVMLFVKQAFRFIASYAMGIANEFTKTHLCTGCENKVSAFVQQAEIRVFDEDGTVLGYLKADLLVETRLICEIKGAGTIVDEHVAQLLGYLRASRLEHGLLINFGAPRLQIKKLILS